MRFTCEKALLQTAINTTGRAVAAKTSIPALEGILVEALGFLRLTGYNLETGIQSIVPAEIQEQGALVLPAQLFGEMVRKLPDAPVTLSSQGLKVSIDCVSTHFDIQAIDPEDFPELPEVQELNRVIMSQQDLKRMLEDTLFSVSNQDIRPIYTGALFEVEGDHLTVVTSDGFRLAMRREKYQKNLGDETYSFVVPSFALNGVKNICQETDDAVVVAQGNYHILFTIGDTIVVCRRLEGSFLNYKQAIPKDNKISVTCETSALMSSISRVSLILSDKLKNPLRCTFQKNEIAITTRSAIGNSSDVCPMTGDGEGLEIGFDSRYLYEALRYAPASQVRLELSTPVSPCVILPVEDKDNFLYLVLPVRLKAGD